MKKQKRTITVVCDEQPGSVVKVAKQLRSLGFEVEQELEFAGSIIGQWDDDLLKLKQIPGVQIAEESEEKFTQGVKPS